jgi:hypothetical protein
MIYPAITVLLRKVSVSAFAVIAVIFMLICTNTMLDAPSSKSRPDSLEMIKVDIGDDQGDTNDQQLQEPHNPITGVVIRGPQSNTSHAPAIPVLIEPIETIVDEITSAFADRPTNNQQTLRNYIDFANLVREEAIARHGCNLLVFGLGSDSEFIARANAVPGSLSVFVESSKEWAQRLAPVLSAAVLRVAREVESPRIVLYAYTRTRVRDTRAILALEPVKLHKRLWMRELPAYVLKTAWDVVLIDAPPGYSSEQPGRLQPLYTTSRLVHVAHKAEHRPRDARPRHVFVHDYTRLSESAGIQAFFSGANLTKNSKLAHLLLPPLVAAGIQAHGVE